MTEAESALNHTLSLDDPSSPSIGAMRIMATMRQQKGEHASAIEVLDKALALQKDEQVRPQVLGRCCTEL